jgi:hypothetical protein
VRQKFRKVALLTLEMAPDAISLLFPSLAAWAKIWRECAIVLVRVYGNSDVTGIAFA